MRIMLSSLARLYVLAGLVVFGTAINLPAAPPGADIPKPANLDIEKLKAAPKVDAIRATIATNAAVGGYISPFFSFDLVSDAPNAMILLRDPSPFGRVNFTHVPIELVMVEYIDPKSGISGDIYSADVPGSGRRYFLLGSARHKSWIVYFDSQGQVQMYLEANIGYSKS